MCLLHALLTTHFTEQHTSLVCMELPYFLFEDEHRDAKGVSSLKGTPVAIVHSSVGSLAGKFLTAVVPGFDVSEAQKHAALRTMHDRVKREQAGGSAKASAAAALMHDIHNKGKGGSGMPSGGHPITPAELDSVDTPVEKKRKRYEDIEAAETASTPRARFIKLPPGSWFEQIPLYRMDDPRASKSEYRHTQYIAGPAGCGKSVLVAGLVKKFRRIWPDYPVFGVCKTRLEDDTAYRGLGIRQVPLAMMKKKEDDAGGHLKELFGDAGCLLLFDDWDSFAKTERVGVLQLMTDVLNLGRKMRISVIVTSHRITNYLETRAIIEESEFVTLFPQDTLRARLEYLGDCIGLPTGLIDRARKLGRSFTVHKRAPMYILSTDQCEMLE